MQRLCCCAGGGEDVVCTEDEALVASNNCLNFYMRCYKVAALIPYLSAALRMEKVFDITGSIFHVFFVNVFSVSLRFIGADYFFTKKENIVFSNGEE